MADFLGKLFPVLARRASRREELTELLQESVGDKASFDSHEGALLQNFLSLRDLTAVDVMIPRADIFAVSLNDTFDDIIQQIRTANYSYQGFICSPAGGQHPTH
jgi:magnesium and cobalt transporter